MTWTVVIKHIRPNTGVDWYVDPESSIGSALSDADVDYVQSTFIDTGKRISQTSSESDDGLESTKTYVYRDNAAYIEYITDDRVKSFVQEQITYNLTNEIDSTRSSEET